MFFAIFAVAQMARTGDLSQLLTSTGSSREVKYLPLTLNLAQSLSLIKSFDWLTHLVASIEPDFDLDQAKKAFKSKICEALSISRDTMRTARLKAKVEVLDQKIASLNHHHSDSQQLALKRSQLRQKIAEADRPGVLSTKCLDLAMNFYYDWFCYYSQNRERLAQICQIEDGLRTAGHLRCASDRSAKLQNSKNLDVYLDFIKYQITMNSLPALAGGSSVSS